MVDKSTSENRGHRHSLGCSLHRPQNRPEPANTGRRGRAMVRPDRLSPKLPVNGGRGAPRTMPAPDGDANSHAAVSSSPGDTVSAPCRGSRPGPAALDRPPQSRGPAPARPGRYGRLDESSTGDSGGRPPWGRGCQAAAGRQATLTIGSNRGALSSQIDHTARHPLHRGSIDHCIVLFGARCAVSATVQC